MGINNHNCRAFSGRVIMYLDGTLSRQEERALLVEMRSCPYCLEKFSRERAFREFIKSKVNRRKVSPMVVQSIKEKIRVSAI